MTMMQPPTKRKRSVRIPPGKPRPGRRSFAWSRQALVLYYGLKHPKTPFFARLPAFFSLAYLLSPIDLIPDFIPLAGWLDDLFIVPALFALSIRLFPREVRADSELKANSSTKKIRLLLGLFLVLLLLLLVGLFFLGKRLFFH